MTPLSSTAIPMVCYGVAVPNVTDIIDVPNALPLRKKGNMGKWQQQQMIQIYNKCLSMWMFGLKAALLVSQNVSEPSKIPSFIFVCSLTLCSLLSAVLHPSLPPELLFTPQLHLSEIVAFSL